MGKHIDSKVQDENVAFYNTTWFWKLIIPVLMTVIGGAGVSIVPTFMQKQPVSSTVTLESISHDLDSLGDIIGKTNATIIRIKATQDSLQMVRLIREQVLLNQQNPNLNDRMMRVMDSTRIMMIKPN